MTLSCHTVLYILHYVIPESEPSIEVKLQVLTHDDIPRMEQL